MIPVLLVALGGALGAVARFLVGTWFVRRLGATWPYATLFINLTGCFLIALFLTAATERMPGLNGGWRYLFPIGFVGAYTTFSTYEYELARLVSAGEVAAAFGYFAASNVLGFGAVLLGSWLARTL
jgi:fluoride exporter